jgi:eukaryotic-like serine/threonine-protein kinase
MDVCASVAARPDGVRKRSGDVIDSGDRSDWQAVNDLFHAALRRGGDERTAFLADACAGNATRRQQVERLIRAHENDPRLLDRPVAADALELLAGEQLAAPGTLIGRYRLVREIGRGGMGAVYLAERADDEFSHHVAVKLIKRGMDTELVLRHFRDERQIMASLEHANIARLLDGGTTADGLPYFVMEHVAGQRIDQYSQDRQLGIDRRLALFEQVCAAVSYAHQRLIIHRDIKPANILVTADGTAKLLDFGIAKFVTADGPAQTSATTLGLRPMTPEYASPEQLQGLRVDALSDVYSLGVLLFELLTDRLPNALTGLPPPEAARIMATVEAPKASAVAEPRLRRQLRGDLDTIVLTALATDRDRRYRSVDQLSEDLRRHREGRPIGARRTTWRYRTGKFVNRNRLAVASGAIVLATLSWGLVSTSREAARADRQAAIAQAVAAFLQDDLIGQANSANQASPTTRADANLTVRAALDRAAARVDGRFAADPAVEAAIRQTIGDAYHGLGLYAPAQEQMVRSLELRRTALGAIHADTLNTLTKLGSNYYAQGAAQQAAAMLTDAVAGWRRLYADNHPQTLAALADLALAVRATGDLARAATVYTDVLRVQRQLLGDEHPDTLAVMNNLAAVYGDQGRFADGEALLKTAVATKTRVLGADPPSTLMSVNGLGIAYRVQGKYAEAEPLLRTVLDARSRVLGAEHRDVLSSRHSLARVYEAEGRRERSQPLLLQNLEIRRRVLGREHPDTMSGLAMLAESYRRQGRYAEADPLFAELLDVRRRTLTPNHPGLFATLTSVAALKRDQQQFGAAERLLREALKGYASANTTTWQRYYSEALLGATLLDSGRRDEAGRLLSAAYPALLQRTASIPVEDRPLLELVKAWTHATSLIR